MRDAMVFIFGVSLFLASLVSWTGEIAAGFTKDDVIRALGRPKHSVGLDEKEVLRYAGRKVVLVNGVVVDTGDVEAPSDSRQSPALAAPAAERTHQPEDETPGLAKRHDAAAKYVADVRTRTERRIARLKKQKLRSLRKLEQRIHTLGNPPHLLDPVPPMTSAPEEKWDAFRQDVQDRALAEQRRQIELANAIEEKARIDREYETLREHAVAAQNCDQVYLQFLGFEYGTIVPDLRVGYVGFVGTGRVLQRLGNTRALMYLVSIPGTPLVHAADFPGLPIVVDGQFAFPGIVEVVGTHTYTTLEDTRSTVYEMRPYVRGFSGSAPQPPKTTSKSADLKILTNPATNQPAGKTDSAREKNRTFWGLWGLR